MISNQYQFQPNFQGNLLKEGLKLPQKKFNEVARIYAEKTKDMPDLKLVGIRNRSDFDGCFFHSTHVVTNGDSIASLPTGSFKKMFNEYSPKKMAEELINITKELALNEQFTTLTKEIDSLNGKINNIRKQIIHVADPIAKKRLQVLSDRMGKTLDKKEKELAEVKSSGNNFSKEWSIDSF